MLQTRPQFAHLPYDTVKSAVEGAEAEFLDYTNRTTVPPKARMLIVDMAAVRLIRLGAEGTTSVSDDGSSRSWEAVPSDIRTRLDRWRRPLWP